VISSTSSMFSSRPCRMTSNVRRINGLLAGSTVERERKRAGGIGRWDEPIDPGCFPLPDHSDFTMGRPPR
jgi:hypothetical protein